VLWSAAHFTFCPVPEKGYDTLLFMTVALMVAATLQGKMSAILVFTAGNAGLYKDRVVVHVMCRR